MSHKKYKLVNYLRHNQTTYSIIASIMSILVGILFGIVLLFILKPSEALYGLSKMLLTGFSSPDKFGKILYQAMPLIMTGLSVGFAFKTGLFNIGAPGQYLIGTFFALFVVLVLKLPWWLAIIFAGVGGAIWGAVPGIFKALLGVNEVITSIMFNWIGLFLVNVLISNTPKMLSTTYGGTGGRTAPLAVVNPQGMLPKLGLDRINPSLTMGILLAIFMAIVIYLIIDKTTFGYELKACGFNKNASKYAGINEKRNIILSMIIAGSLAGIGGGLYYLNGGTTFTIGMNLPAMGFNGIPVALLAMSNPLGIIFSAIFISYIQVGGEAMQPEFAPEAISIIIAVIIYLSAFSLLFKTIIARGFSKNKFIEELSNNESNNSNIQVVKSEMSNQNESSPQNDEKESK